MTKQWLKQKKYVKFREMLKDFREWKNFFISRDNNKNSNNNNCEIIRMTELS